MTVKSREEMICWTFGGSASVEAKVGILVELLGKMGLTLTADFSREGCVTLPEAIQYQIPWEQCYDTHGRDVTTEHSGSLTKTTAELVYRWRLWDPVSQELWDVAIPCKETSISVTLNAVRGRELQIAPYPERCGSIVPDPDPYDGKRSDPCCSPLPPCDPPPPDGRICCGCEGVR